MATILKRLRTLGLSLAFVVGMTAQLMPSMAETPATESAGIAGCCESPQPPCSGHLPDCLDHGGCISGSVVLASPATIAVPVEWASLGYHLVLQVLSGISVKPELSPPILAA